MLDILGPMVYDLLPPFLPYSGSEAGYGLLGCVCGGWRPPGQHGGAATHSTGTPGEGEPIINDDDHQQHDSIPTPLIFYFFTVSTTYNKYNQTLLEEVAS